MCTLMREQVTNTHKEKDAVVMALAFFLTK